MAHFILLAFELAWLSTKLLWRTFVVQQKNLNLDVLKTDRIDVINILSNLIG